MRTIGIISLALLLILTVVHDTDLAESRANTLFYFNPDSPQSNLSRLKRDMDDFLSEAGFPLAFQPFAHLVDFENQLRKAPPAFIFIPEWYLRRYGAELHLHPLLIPVRNGRVSYRKVLLGPDQKEPDSHRLSPLTVAMTSMGPYGEDLLNTVMFAPNGAFIGKVSTIIVPKDMDALFALALGQVDMALVVKENMDLIAKINPNILRSVRPMLESEPIPMPVLCAVGGVASDTAIEKLKTLFLENKKRQSRLNIMEMLQINEWQAINP